jgi:hypothetical protein
MEGIVTEVAEGVSPACTPPPARIAVADAKCLLSQTAKSPFFVAIVSRGVMALVQGVGAVRIAQVDPDLEAGVRKDLALKKGECFRQPVPTVVIAVKYLLDPPARNLFIVRNALATVRAETFSLADTSHLTSNLNN